MVSVLYPVRVLYPVNGPQSVDRSPYFILTAPLTGYVSPAQKKPIDNLISFSHPMIFHCQQLKEHYHVFAHAREFDFRTGGILVPRAYDPSGLRQESRGSGSNHFERTKEITEFWLSGSLRICIYGACLKWLLPEPLDSCRRQEGSWALGTRMNRGSRIQRCGNWHRAFTNPFASSSVNFGFALKLLRIKDQWYTVLVKCQFVFNRVLSVLISMPFDGTSSERKCYGAGQRRLSFGSFQKGLKNRERTEK